MTHLHPARRRTAVGRRSLLLGTGAAALVAASGCSWVDRSLDGPGEAVHPDHALLTAARDDQEALLAQLSATREAHDGLVAVIEPMIVRATERLTALQHALGEPESAGEAGATQSSSTQPTATSPTSHPTDAAAPSAAVPPRPRAARRQLLRASRETASRRSQACAEAVDQGVARLLAALAAGYAQDVEVLQTGGDQ